MANASALKDSCVFNGNILCQTRLCAKCGWNPDVRKERMEKLEREGSDALRSAAKKD